MNKLIRGTENNSSKIRKRDNKIKTTRTMINFSNKIKIKALNRYYLSCKASNGPAWDKWAASFSNFNNWSNQSLNN